MSVADYKKIALDAVGTVAYKLAEASNQNPIKTADNTFIQLGVFSTSRSQSAMRAIIQSRRKHTQEVRESHLTKHAQNDGVKVEQFRLLKQYCDTFIPPSYSEYLEALKGRNRIAQQLKELNTLYTQANHDSVARWRHIEDNLPLPQLVRMVKNYNPDIFTPNLEGWGNLLISFNNEFIKATCRDQFYYFKETDRAKHTYITGGSGAGKSELLKQLIWSYLSVMDYASLVVIDPHGDMSRQIARWRYFWHNPNKLVYIDPNLSQNHTPAFNPLDLPEGVNADVYAQQLVSAFEHLLEGDGGHSLTVNMRALLLPCLKVLLKMEGATLLDLQRFMATGSGNTRAEKYINLGCQDSNVLTADFFQHEFTSNKFDSTKQSIATKITSLINTEAEQRLFLNPSTFDLLDIIEKRQVLLLRFSKGEIGESSSKALGRFIVAALQSIAMRRASEEEADRVPVHLFLDECQNFISKDVESILQEARKYKLHLTMAQQIYGMGMSADMKKIVMGNSHIKIAGLNGDHSTQSAMGASMRATPDLFENLKTGRFLVQVGEHDPLEVGVLDFMIDDPSLDPEHHANMYQSKVEFTVLCNKQLSLYYRPINDPAEETQSSETPANDKDTLV
jgi:Type IV secretory system Conjugative DNA transfer|tara:strand:+ start:6238 stop:8094 length:1857 start_codon:yes stop_codon:yes gene_type:complete